MATTTLPVLLDEPPKWGRLKSPQPRVYATVQSQLDRRELADTGGSWFDVRRVTIRIYGPIPEVKDAARAVRAVYNRLSTLVYPPDSSARFFKLWPEGDTKLYQDPDTRLGEDVWIAEIEFLVWSIRPD